MTPEQFLGGRVALYPGDCREAVTMLADASVDAVVTDPPYALTSIVKRFGAADAAPAKADGATGVYRRVSAGFMGQKWDNGAVAFDPAFWADVLRVLKPGGHVVAFGGTRTQHRLVCAIEAGGFEIRDALAWLYGQGFPKSLDVAKAIDKEIGVEGVFGPPKSARHAESIKLGRSRPANESGWNRPHMQDPEVIERHARRYMPASLEASGFDGWGTALKPAMELICLARKPLIGAVAENVLAHGTGGLNIDGCRIEVEPRKAMKYMPTTARSGYSGGLNGSARDGLQQLGRWPANVAHDGSDEVLAEFPETRPSTGTARRSKTRPKTATKGSESARTSFGVEDDGGSVARFFYCAKASAADRLGFTHPTVKPLALMRWLVRLVTPPGGLILDPFAGTGTTGIAALAEGMLAILIEREPKYQDFIRERLQHFVPAGPIENRKPSKYSGASAMQMEMFA